MTRWILLIVLAACSVRHVDPKEPPPPVDAGCGAVCDWLRENGCEAGKPADDGTPCEGVCEYAEELVPSAFQDSVRENGCGEP